MSSMIFTHYDAPKYPRKFMEELAQIIKKQNIGKVYKYTILDNLYAGICTIDDVSYDSIINGFIFCLKDINTGNWFMTERCHMYLKEIDKME